MDGVSQAGLHCIERIAAQAANGNTDIVLRYFGVQIPLSMQTAVRQSDCKWLETVRSPPDANWSL